LDETMLIRSPEQEYEPPGQNGIKGSAKEFRLLDGVADDRRAGQIVPESRNKRWGCVYTEDVEPFGHQDRGDRKARPAPKVYDAAAPRQCSRPLPHFFHPDSDGG